MLNIVCLTRPRHTVRVRRASRFVSTFAREIVLVPLRLQSPPTVRTIRVWKDIFHFLTVSRLIDRCLSAEDALYARFIFHSIRDTLMFSSPAWYFRWPIVFTMDLAARENIVIPVGVLLEIFVTPSLGVWHVQIATNGSGYQVKRCICFPRSFDSVHREKQNRSSNEHVCNGSESLLCICT